ncbi:MAG: ice-binding family protein [Candidatus Paceibacterota bacterium]|jgi:hypothetical protein
MKNSLKKIILNTAILSMIAFTFGLIGSTKVFAAGPPVIDLLSIITNNFVILAETAVTDANPALTLIVGNIGLSSAAGSNIAGLSCTEITGSIYDVDGTYTGGHDSNISCLLAGPGANKTLVDNAVLDMGIAYVDGNTRTAATGAELNVGGGTLNGQNFAPGLYTWTTNVTITGDITLTGSASDIWIFQVQGTLDLASNKQILLAGGAVNSNVFWVITGSTTLFPSSVFRGNILDQTNIAMQLGSTLQGRALSQTAVTFIGNNISTTYSLIDTNAPVITLDGVTPNIAIGGVYIELGATATDDIDVPFPATPSGSVNTVVIGAYIITYNATDSSGNVATPVTRTVNVIDGNIPVITLNGVTSDITVGGIYTELGATALDDIDGSFAATSSGTVDTNTVGAYIITYTAMDSSGNVATPVTRTVNVIERRSSGGSSGGGTHFGCKDINAINYEYFSASKPSLCKYATITSSTSISTTTIAIIALLNSTNANVPSLPNTGFPPEENMFSSFIVSILNLLSIY